MRSGVLALSLLAFSGCNEDSSKNSFNKKPIHIQTPAINLDQLTLDLYNYLEDGIDYSEKVKILSRCGYKINAFGFFHRQLYISKGEDWQRINSDDIRNFPLSSSDIISFLSSYSKN